MYGIDSKVEFLTAKNQEGFPGQELVVQVEWPHIVGCVYRFGVTESQEAVRVKWVENMSEDAPVVQSVTHRVYVKLAGTLQDVRRDKIERAKGMPIREYVRGVLERMAEYVVDGMSDGQRYALRWDMDIVDDDYWNRLRKARKNKEL